MQNDDYRLPIICDALNLAGPDDEFFLALANETLMRECLIWVVEQVG